MYSVVLMAAMSTAPAEPARLFHRRSAGCTGVVAATYQLAPAAGCTGVATVRYAVPVAVAPAVVYAPAVPAPVRTPIRTAASSVVPRYERVCVNGVCYLRRVN